MMQTTNQGKHLIGTECPECKHGELKKKYNRQVKPAKPFVGCTNYPVCEFSIEMDETIAGREERLDWQALEDCWVEDYKY